MEEFVAAAVPDKEETLCDLVEETHVPKGRKPSPTKGATQLDATASVAGTFVYRPASGTVAAPVGRRISIIPPAVRYAEYPPNGFVVMGGQKS